MRILYFHQHFSTPKGYCGTRSYEIAKRLIDRGHHVTMICGRGRSSKTGLSNSSVKGLRSGIVDGIKVIELDIPYSHYYGFIKRTKVFLLYALQSIKLALTLDCDLIFATSTPLSASIPGIVGKIVRKKTFIFEVRDLWPELLIAMGVLKNPVIIWAMNMLEWVSYNTATACIGLSPGIVKGIKKRCSKEKNVIMIPNACDLELFSKKTIKYRHSDINKDDLIAIYTGSHGEANGLDAVVDAAEVLKKRGVKNIKFVFIGEGKTKSNLLKRCENSNIDNCIFIDPVNKEKLSQYLHGADIALMILANVPEFYYGTSPNKFFDYIACGLPILNNYPGWIAELIEENYCGIAIKPDQPEIFADTLEMIEKNRERLKIMSKNSMDLATKTFDRKKIADEMIDFIERYE
jgi:glycosyltransferase involved in cell wall biosynthesis